MRIIFMGTPEFAVYSLKALLQHHEVIAVVTQPDKPKGRGKKMVATPVKAYAVEEGIPVYQPLKAREEAFVQVLQELQPDLIAVTAYGQILPESILNIPRLGCINVHGSLLPKYRGAAPMQWAVINGETKTGITTMYMAKGMDTGDMLLKTEVEISPLDNFGTVHDKMAVAGAELLIETLSALEEGSVERIAQNHEEATYSPMISKEDGKIDWTKSAKRIRDLIRGLDPIPGAYTKYGEDILKIFGAEVDTMSSHDIYGNTTNHSNICGTILEITKKGIIIQCGVGTLMVTQLQARGGKRMETDAYLRGHEMPIGSIVE